MTTMLFLSSYYWVDGFTDGWMVGWVEMRSVVREEGKGTNPGAVFTSLSQCLLCSHRTLA